MADEATGFATRALEHEKKTGNKRRQAQALNVLCGLARLKADCEEEERRSLEMLELTRTMDEPLATTGEAKPSPTGSCHRGLSSAGSLTSNLSPVGTYPSRLGPRHWGQSAGRPHSAHPITASSASAPVIRVVMVGGSQSLSAH